MGNTVRKILFLITQNYREVSVVPHSGSRLIALIYADEKQRYQTAPLKDHTDVPKSSVNASKMCLDMHRCF